MFHFTLPHKAVLTKFPIGLDKIPHKWQWAVTSGETGNDVQKKLVSFYETVENETVQSFANILFSRIVPDGIISELEAIACVPLRSFSGRRQLLLRPPKDIDTINRFSKDSFVCFMLAFGGLMDISASGYLEFASQPEEMTVADVGGRVLLRLPNGGHLIYVSESGLVKAIDHGYIREHSNSLAKALEWWLASIP